VEAAAGAADAGEYRGLAHSRFRRARPGCRADPAGAAAQDFCFTLAEQINLQKSETVVGFLIMAGPDDGGLTSRSKWHGRYA
jgi:hypothetical protein